MAFIWHFGTRSTKHVSKRFMTTTTTVNFFQPCRSFVGNDDFYFFIFSEMWPRAVFLSTSHAFFVFLTYGRTVVNFFFPFYLTEKVGHRSNLIGFYVNIYFIVSMVILVKNDQANIGDVKPSIKTWEHVGKSGGIYNRTTLVLKLSLESWENYSFDWFYQLSRGNFYRSIKLSQCFQYILFVI